MSTLTSPKTCATGVSARAMVSHTCQQIYFLSLQVGLYTSLRQASRQRQRMHKTPREEATKQGRQLAALRWNGTAGLRTAATRMPHFRQRSSRIPRLPTLASTSEASPVRHPARRLRARRLLGAQSVFRGGGSLKSFGPISAWALWCTTRVPMISTPCAARRQHTGPSAGARGQLGRQPLAGAWPKVSL